MFRLPGIAAYLQKTVNDNSLETNISVKIDPRTIAEFRKKYAP